MRNQFLHAIVLAAVLCVPIATYAETYYTDHHHHGRPGMQQEGSDSDDEGL